MTSCRVCKARTFKTKEPRAAATVHCFWGKCEHVVEAKTSEAASRVMQTHYDACHAADLTDLGYPTEPAYADGLLPDVEGYVHGIVAIDPVWVIQCDGCGRVAIGDLDRHGKRSNHVIQVCGILFDTSRRDPRRMCGRCRVAAGWTDWETAELRRTAADENAGALLTAEQPAHDIPVLAQASSWDDVFAGIGGAA